jgi:hypothetical protein
LTVPSANCCSSLQKQRRYKPPTDDESAGL